MGIIQAKCLIKVKIGFSKETFACTVFVTYCPSQNYKFSQNFLNSQNSQMKGLSKWLPLPKNIFTLGQNVSFLLVDQSPSSILSGHSKKAC